MMRVTGYKAGTPHKDRFKQKTITWLILKLIDYAVRSCTREEKEPINITTATLLN